MKGEGSSNITKEAIPKQPTSKPNETIIEITKSDHPDVYRSYTSKTLSSSNWKYTSPTDYNSTKTSTVDIKFPSKYTPLTTEKYVVNKTITEKPKTDYTKEIQTQIISQSNTRLPTDYSYNIYKGSDKKLPVQPTDTYYPRTYASVKSVTSHHTHSGPTGYSTNYYNQP